MKNRALFLDRDGIINHLVRQPSGDFDSPQHPDQVSLIPGIETIISYVQSLKIPVIVITNQPGVAKGKMSEKTLQEIQDRVNSLLLEKGVTIEHIYQCLHHPLGTHPELTQVCDCRKPKPGLLLQAAQDLNIDLSSSVLFGDNVTDMEAGMAAGCTTILFDHDNDVEEKIQAKKNYPQVYRSDSMSEIFNIIKSLFN